MANQANNAGGDQSQAGEQDQQNNQDQGAAGGNGGDSGNREYEQLPDDHPLVKRLEALKAENKVLKPKAKLVDDAEEAKKTDAQKIADLQAKVDAQPKAVAEALREHLVELHGIDKDDAELFLTGDTPELLLKQVGRLLEQGGAGGSKRKNYVQKEGNHQRKPAESENGAFAKSLFGGSDD
ncbi:scaffolding protein [Mycobacterium phage Sweets]|uniref:Scaffolding protein n=2 Tax=Mycobacterium virus Halo TaxID=373407 RepID=Q1A0S3_9CAUD|nr:scaffolding protein [Mycobacterium phage Halo]ABE67263.1 hypothetical protein PBI_HALO_6 [Mycobacterium phage Halo]AYD84659.1 scaffolding protein [Mycobacterium phage Sweets]